MISGSLWKQSSLSPFTPALGEPTLSLRIEIDAPLRALRQSDRIEDVVDGAPPKALVAEVRRLVKLSRSRIRRHAASNDGVHPADIHDSWDLPRDGDPATSEGHRQNRVLHPKRPALNWSRNMLAVSRGLMHSDARPSVLRSIADASTTVVIRRHAGSISDKRHRGFAAISGRSRHAQPKRCDADTRTVASWADP